MQLSFLDTAESRLRELSAHGDPLERLNQVIDWEMFSPILSKLGVKPRKSSAGRPKTNSILMFKIQLLKHLYALSDDAVEYQIRDNNKFKSRKRSRVEHVFASIKGSMRGARLRCIGKVRAAFRIGLMNLTYNIQRVETLIRLKVFEFDRVIAPTAK